jgi:hypothetical protein
VTIDEKLFAILTGSPLPIPEIGSRVFPITAEQGTVKPYLVLELISSGKFFTQDEQQNPGALNRWRYSFTIISSEFLVGRLIMGKLQRFLTTYTDRPGKGIHRMLEITGRGGWVEIEREFQFTSDFDIVENLT